MNTTKLLKKYFPETNNILKIMRNMEKENYDPEKYTIEEYLQIRLKNICYEFYGSDNKIYGHDIAIKTIYESQEYILLFPLSNYLNDKFENISCDVEPIDSSTFIFIDY